MIFVEGGSRRQREVTYDIASFAWMKLMPRIRKCTVNIKLKKHNLWYHPFIVSRKKDKQTYASKNMLLIDDAKENVEQFRQAGGHAILHIDAVDTIEQLKKYAFYED